MKFVFSFMIIAVSITGAYSQTSAKETTQGSWDLYITDGGKIGTDSLGKGGTWPRDSAVLDNYLNAAGLWFGCVRSATNTKLVEATYTPKGNAAFTPLSVGGAAEPVYSQSDYNADGTPKTPGMPLWPIRNTAGTPLLKNGNVGTYVTTSAERAASPAAFISDQDIVCALSDSANVQSDFPIGLTGTITAYVWNNDSLKNCVFFVCTLQNTSPDTLTGCYAAPMAAFALGDSTNDYLDAYPTADLRMMYAFSDSEATPLGAAGISIIQTPANAPFKGVDIWASYQDALLNNGYEYQYLSSPYSIATYAGTWRGLASCGPFSMLPGAGVRFAWVLAAALSDSAPNNTQANVSALVKEVASARNWWYGFNTPSAVNQPPFPQSDAVIRNFPNPFSAFTTIEIPANIPLGANPLRIYNELGQDVTGGLLTRIGANSYLLEGARLPNGVYTARLLHSAGVSADRIIVIH